MYLSEHDPLTCAASLTGLGSYICHFIYIKVSRIKIEVKDNVDNLFQLY
ncbi:hypothetical protein PIL02S_00455 [Paenibacillus illinoisensis]|uniref:Uncharacterized protein n=1 Tax=Paenibacillus illinoisensis TaxID=59845 RepID=A0A2W0CKA4_9BACL|nr:hypothetical protein PIL02S_00455 [Paenibacillus illinoisensis]